MNTDYFQTNDLALAAAIALQYPLDNLDKSNPQRAIFFFSRNEALDLYIQAFWSGTLRVPPLAYFNELKVLKSRIYSQEER